MQHLLRLCASPPQPLPLPASSLLLAVEALSRRPAMTWAEGLAWAQASPGLVLEVSCLPKDADFPGVMAQVRKLLPFLGALQVQDPGLALALGRETGLPLHLSLEQGIPNQAAILAWAKAIPQATRLVLSNQLPLAAITALAQQTPVELELQALGQLETLYSPRPLLQKIFPGNACLATSPDRPRQHFPVQETPLGMVMFHDKELFLLDQADRMQAAGVTHLRLEPSPGLEWRLTLDWLAGGIATPQLKALWPSRTTKGFLLKNRTDKPLARLVNQHQQAQAGQELGRILEVTKGSHWVVELFQELLLPQQVLLASPEGTTKPWELNGLTNLQGTVAKPCQPGIYLAPWHKGASPQTRILKAR